MSTTTNGRLKVEGPVHFARGSRGRITLQEGPAPAALPPGRVPRIARLIALAIRFDGLIRTGVVKDYAELARLGHVTRARETQVMNLCLLAPDIQEELLFLPRIEQGRESLVLRDLQLIAATADRAKQRRMWSDLVAGSSGQATPG